MLTNERELSFETGIAMILSELKKTIFKNKFFLLILLAALLRVVFLATEKMPINELTYLAQSKYLELYSHFDGYLTDEKAQEIEQHFVEINNAQADLLMLIQENTAGNVEEDVFLEKSRNYEQLISEQGIFNELYRQFLYARENPETRYLLYDNGWKALLDVERVDWAAVLLMIVFSSTIIVREYETDMHKLLISSKNGNKKVILSKLVVILILAVGCGVFSSLLEFVFIKTKFTLNHGGYPLSSIVEFYNTDYKVTLLQAYILMSLYRVFAFLIISVLTMFVAMITKNAILSMVSSLSIVLLPYILPIQSSAKYKIPGPSSFLMARGYFLGVTEAPTVAVQGAVSAYEGVPMLTQLVYVLGYVVLLIVMSWLIVFMFSSKHTRTSGKRRLLLIVSVFTLLFCSACQSRQSYPWIAGREYSMLNEDIYVNYKNKLVVTWPYFAVVDLDTLQVEELTRNPIQDVPDNPTIKNPACVFRYEDKVLFDYLTPFERMLVEINILSFETNVIHREKIERGFDLDFAPDYFYGKNRMSLPVGNTRCGFIDDKNFYSISNNVASLGSQNYQFEKINIHSGRKELIDDNMYFTTGVAYNGEILFYLSDNYRIHKIQKNDGTDTVLGDLRAASFLLYNNELYFENLDYEGKLYKVDLDGSNAEKVSDVLFWNFSIYQNQLFYKEKDTSKLKVQDLETGSIQTLVDRVIYSFTILQDYNGILFTAYNEAMEGEYFVLNLDTNEIRKIDFPEKSYE